MKTKKIISLLLAILMTLSLSSIFVVAADTTNELFISSTISNAAKAPTMDGKVSETEWGKPFLVTSQNDTNENVKFQRGNNSVASADQRVKVYMVTDETYLYIASTMDHAVATTNANVGNSATPMLSVTLSKYVEGSNVLQVDGKDKYFLGRIYIKNGTFQTPYFQTVSAKDNRVDASRGTSASGKYDTDTKTYSFEMRVPWTSIPGMTIEDVKNGVAFASTMRISDGNTGTASNHEGNRYFIGGNAITEFTTNNNAHDDGALKINLGEWCKSTTTLAEMPATAPVLDNVIGATEYGAPIIVTSTAHVTAVSAKSAYATTTTYVPIDQRAKVYMTNDENYLYLAGTLDNAVANGTGVSAGKGALMTVTLSRYDATNMVYAHNGLDKFLVARYGFGASSTSGTSYAITATDLADGSQTSRVTVASVGMVGVYADNTYTYEMRIPWSAIPGMEDGVYTDAKLAATIRIADGSETDNKQNWYRLGGDAAENFVPVNTHADGVLVLTPNAYAANDADLVENTAYSFMNADTGREIAVGETTEFTAVAAGENFWNLKVGEQYLDLTGSAPVLGDTPVAYVINEVANERYQIRVAGAYVRDTDGGADTAVTLKTEAAISTISSGWYITASGQEKPLRILPIGDSITWGTVPSGQTRDYGWRDELSEGLMDYFGRVVFVGSRIESVESTIETKALYRNEGRPGWTVDAGLAAKDDGEGKDDPQGTKTQGLRTVAASTVNKYDPDVVLLMAGINDVAWLGGNNANGSEATTEELIALHEEYKVLVRELAANMDEGDTIFCSTLTPAPREDLVGAEVKFNDLLAGTVGDLNSELSCAVRINDNYAAFGGSYDGVSSDELHLNGVGDAKVAAQYGQSIRAMYNADSSVKAVVVTTANLASTLANAANGAIIVLGENITVDSLMVPANVTLDLNGKTLTVTGLEAYGDVVDTTLGQGGIAVVGDEPFFNLKQDNSMIALFDEGFGYRFFSYKFDYKVVETGNEDSVKFAIRLDLPTAGAYALLDDEANYDTFFIKLNLSKSEEACPPIDYVFKKDTMKTYVERSSADVTKKYGITLTVYGMSSLEAKDYTFDGAEACLTFANVTLQNAYN